MNRKIIHLDLDAFFCAVEELRNPSLVGVAFAVGGRPEERGVVTSCSYAARRFGVRSAMPMARALKLCPGMTIVSSNHKEYSSASRQVMERLRRLTDLVEQISIDEAFLDVSALHDSGFDIARYLQSTIRDELHLPCSLGVASNKLVAKIATDVGKAGESGDKPPCAITVVPTGEEAAFLAPLPVEALWGVGPKTAARLAELHVTKIGELAAYPEIELRRLFGKNGQELSMHARGIDDRPIVTSREVKSISQETTFTRDISNEEMLMRTLFELCDRVGSRLRQSHLSGSTVKIKIRWPDFTTCTRQMTLAQTTDQESQIYASAVQLFSKEWRKGQPVRLLGVGISGLRPSARQLSLWDETSDKEQRLRKAVDGLRNKYGEGVLLRGSRLKPDEHSNYGSS